MTSSSGRCTHQLAWRTRALLPRRPSSAARPSATSPIRRPGRPGAPACSCSRTPQLRVDITAVDGGLEERMTYEPLDAGQERIFTAFSGGSFPAPPRRLVLVGKDLFAPAGMPLQTFTGYSRQLLVSYHGASDGRPD